MRGPRGDPHLIPLGANINSEDAIAIDGVAVNEVMENLGFSATDRSPVSELNATVFGT
jgi:hypothetical protein